MSAKMITNAISALLALGISGIGSANAAENNSMEAMVIPGMEKCYGVAKSGMNDCSTTKHNCSGEAKINADPNEWLSVPTGLCSRIAGGSTKRPIES